MLGRAFRRRPCKQQTSAPASFIPRAWDGPRKSFCSPPQRVPGGASSYSYLIIGSAFRRLARTQHHLHHMELRCLSYLPPWFMPFSGRCKPCSLLGFSEHGAWLHLCTFSRCAITTHGLSLPPAILQSPISRHSVAESSAAMLLGARQGLLFYTPESCPGQLMP